MLVLEKQEQREQNLFSLRLSLGGSIGGIEAGVLTDVLLGGTNGFERTDIDGLPADAERTDGVFSTKFRPN